MSKTKIILPLLIIAVFTVVSSCKKETPQPTQPLVFVSLTAESDTIIRGESTAITVEATGDYLSFNWELGFDSVNLAATTGILFGPCAGGKTIHYANPCCIGPQLIVCTVSDGVNSARKKIFIEVLEE